MLKPPIHVSRCLLCYLVAWMFAWADGPRARGSDDELDVDAVIDTIESFEKKLQCVEFKCRSVGEGPMRQSNGRWELVDPDSVPFTMSFVRIRPHRNQYLVKFDSVRTAIIGQPPNQRQEKRGMHWEFSNDSNTFRHWYLSKSGEQVPTPGDPGSSFEDSGIIAARADEAVYVQGQGFMSVHGYTCGIGWVPPYFTSTFESTQQLSHILRRVQKSGKFLKVRTRPGGTWEIYCQSTLRSGTRDYLFRAQYDPTVGRVLGIEHGGATTYDWEDWKVFYRADFEYPDEKAIVPSRVTSVGPLNSRSPTGGIWTYEDVHINPEVTQADFRITFPPGIEVTDYVGKKIYVVGEGLENDEAAVHRFMRESGLLADDSGAPESPSHGPRLWLSIPALAVLVLCAVSALIRRKKSKVLPLIVAALALNVGECLAQPADARVSGDQDELQVRQCGHLVTVFALTARRIDYELSVLEEELRPGREGINLADIERVLSAYGLTTVSRQDLKLADLAEMARRGFLCIVPMRAPSGRGHYFVVWQSRRHTSPMVIDVLHSVQPLSRGLTESQFSEGGRIALFVGAPIHSDESSMSESGALRFVPRVLDVGNFQTEGNGLVNSIESGLVLRNETDRPVVVNEVATGCGCAMASWTHGIIAAKTDQEIRLRISPRAWGPGRSRRKVVARLSGGEEIVADLLGNGLTLAGAHGLRFVPTAIEFPVEEEFFQRGDVRLSGPTVSVSGEPDELKRLAIRSSDPWFAASSVLVDKRHARVTLHASLDSDLRERLSSPSRTVRGALHVSTASESDPVEVAVTLVRPQCWVLEPDTAVIEGSSDSAEFEVRPNQALAEQHPQIMSVQASPSGLQVQEIRTGSNRLGLRVIRGTQTKSRAYVVTAEVKGALAVDQVRSVVVVR